ncbi:MAG: CbiX/SirB N-terminal domain-containing protein [Gammaproteobacteria bacterium]|nr:CbiX/SirB N-terminal domain-containing protein [Gammaproteobacteria bacterium]
MKALVLVAHGSRRQASNQEVITLARNLAAKMNTEYPIIEAGFLELAEPLIPDSIDRCVQQGATDVCVIPYFLSAGRHVQEDVPAEVDKARAVHHQITMEVLPHIGGSTMMLDLIRNSVINRANRN